MITSPFQKYELYSGQMEKQLNPINITHYKNDYYNFLCKKITPQGTLKKGA
jgi:hypothetical protein